MASPKSLKPPPANVPNYLFRRIIIFDPIDMEYVLEEIDASRRPEAVATALKTVAEVHQDLAKGAEKIAGMLGGAKSRG